MPNCISPDALRMAYENNTNPEGTQRSQPNGQDFYRDLEDQSVEAIQVDQNLRDEAINSINGAIGAQTGMPFSGFVSSLANSAGKIFSAQTAREAIRNATGKFFNIYDKILGVQSVGQTNIGLQLSNKLSFYLKNKQAPIEGWLLLDAPMEGRNAGSNEAVAALRKIDREAIGHMRDFNDTLFTPFLEQIKSVSDNLGFSSNVEFARMVGEYANMRHMKEANAYWLAKHQEEITQLQTSRASARDEAALGKIDKRINKLQHEVDRFMKYRDWIYQVDENGRGIQCAGRTDGYAQAWIDNFHKMYNVDPVTMEGYAQQLTEIVQTLNGWNIAQGNVEVGNVKLLESNPFKSYVPLKSAQSLSTGLPTDSTILNAGTFHAREGMDSRTPIANAFDSIRSHAQRIAMDNASRDFGMVLASMYKNAVEQGRATPIRIENYDVITAKANEGGSYGQMNRNILEGKNGFMLTFMMPEVGADGQLTVRRKIVTFDDTYVDAAQNVSGHVLNESMKAVQQNILTRLFSPVTGFLGGLNTHYNVFFPPVNMLKDAGERLSNMFGQSYKMADGNMINGEHFIGSYIASVPEVMAFLPKVMLGKVANLADSPIGRYWQEYVSHGVKQEFDPIWHKDGQETNQVLQQLAKDKRMGPVLSMIKSFDDATRRKFINAIHKYNDYFNNVASFAQYYTLRKNGVSIDSAANGTMEVINLRESGAFSNGMRAVWAFAKPTMQGASSLLRSLGLSPNASGQFTPSLKGMAFFVGQMGVIAAMYNIFKSMGGEEQADNLSMDDVSRYMFIALDKEGNTAKLPLPFGPTPLAAAFAIGMDRLLRGKMEPMDFVGHMIRQSFKATTPAEFPAYAMSDGFGAYLGSLFTPSAVQPLFQILTNKGHYGSQLTYGDPNSTTPMYMQGKVSTPTGWSKFAKLVNEYSGGMINMAPEEARTLVEGYMGGITRIIPDLISRESLATMGFDESTQGILGRAMSTLGASMVYKKIPQTHTQQFYTEYNKLKKEIRGLGIKLPEKGAYSDAAGRENVWRDKLEEAGYDSDKIERYLTLYNAEQEKRKLTQELKQNTVENEDFPDMTHDEIQALFNQYVEDCDELYKEALGVM